MQCSCEYGCWHCKILGVEENRVTLELQGVNHFIFATDVFVDGSSVMDTIVEKYANVTAEDTLAMKNFISLPYSPSFIRGLHAIPVPIIITISLQRNSWTKSWNNGKKVRCVAKLYHRLKKNSLPCTAIKN